MELCYTWSHTIKQREGNLKLAKGDTHQFKISQYERNKERETGREEGGGNEKNRTTYCEMNKFS